MKISAYTALLALTVTALTACGGSDGDGARDMVLPTISETGITANPIDCQQYQPGDTIPFQYVFKDNVQLGNYNIEIHSNFDHHSHGTSAVTCEKSPHEEGKKAWVFNQSYAIPAAATSFTAQQKIPVPTDIATGDYHFMIRLTDAAGNQEIKAVAIKIAK